MYTLGIETSCDETSAAILKNYKVLSNITISSLREHSRYGGVIPEIATRAHLSNIDKVVKLALEKSKLTLKDIDLIAVTHKPGLFGALIIGLNFAKTLAFNLNIPFIGVNHLYAHLFASFLDNKNKLKFPFLGVVISGGHTQLYKIFDFNKIKLIGSTRDDACGEVYDKIARILGLGYPGGPIIDKLFNLDYKDTFLFRCGKSGFSLSFSGIKTAVLYKANQLEKEGKLNQEVKVKLISSFQASVVDTLVNTIKEAKDKFHLKTVVCGGGVVANSYLRKKLLELESRNSRVLLSPLGYSGDNGAVVAGLGYYLHHYKHKTSKLSLPAEAS